MKDIASHKEIEDKFFQKCKWRYSIDWGRFQCTNKESKQFTRACSKRCKIAEVE